MLNSLCLNEALPQRDNNDAEKARMATALMFKKHYQLTGIILGYSLGSLFILGGGGYVLDLYLGTRPILMAIGVFLSFLITNFLLIRKFSK